MQAMLEARVAMLERQLAAMMQRRGTPFALARSTLAVPLWRSTTPARCRPCNCNSIRFRCATMCRCCMATASLARGGSAVPTIDHASLAGVDDAFQRDDTFKRLAERTKRDCLYNIKPAIEWPAMFVLNI